MASPDPAFDFKPITYEEMQAHIARGRALQSAYIAASFAKLGRLLVGRSGKPAARRAGGAPAHPAG